MLRTDTTLPLPAGGPQTRLLRLGPVRAEAASSRHGFTPRIHTTPAFSMSQLRGALRAPSQRKPQMKREERKFRVQLWAQLSHRSSPDFRDLKTRLCLETRFFTEQVRSEEGFPRSLRGKDSVCQCRRHRRPIPGWGRSPGEEMATHPSVLAGRIPWTEEPGGPQSTGPQKSQTRPSH